MIPWYQQLPRCTFAMNRPDDEREAAAEQVKAKPFVRSERLGDNDRAVKQAAVKNDQSGCLPDASCISPRLPHTESLIDYTRASGRGSEKIGPWSAIFLARQRLPTCGLAGQSPSAVKRRRSTVGEYATRRLLRSVRGQSPGITKSRMPPGSQLDESMGDTPLHARSNTKVQLFRLRAFAVIVSAHSIRPHERDVML